MNQEGPLWARGGCTVPTRQTRPRPQPGSAASSRTLCVPPGLSLCRWGWGEQQLPRALGRVEALLRVKPSVLLSDEQWGGGFSSLVAGRLMPKNPGSPKEAVRAQQRGDPARGPALLPGQ